MKITKAFTTGIAAVAFAAPVAVDPSQLPSRIGPDGGSHWRKAQSCRRMTPLGNSSPDQLCTELQLLLARARPGPRGAMKIPMAGAGALAAGLLALGTPLAHADASQAAFVHQVQSMGVGGTSDDILNNGYVMCNTLRTTDLDIHAVAVQAASQTGVWVGLAAGEVGAAIRWLCPDQIGQFARSHR